MTSPFEKVLVMVVGDAMLDRYWNASITRISPEAPVPVAHIQNAHEPDDRPGGGANVAANLSALGTRCQLYCLVGDDENARVLEHLLQQRGIDPQLFADATAQTIVKLRIMQRNNQIIRLDFEQPFSVRAAQTLTTHVVQDLAQADVVVLSDYGKGSLAHPQQIITAAREQSIPVLADPKGNDFTRYTGATLITPNENEFQAIAGHCSSDADYAQRGEEMRARYQLDALLITRGPRGMTLVQKEREPLHLPAEAHQVFDVTGAGDTVISTIAAALGAAMPLGDAVALGNRAAGMIVGKLGTSTISYRELSEGYADTQPLHTLQSLKRLVDDAREQGQRIVFTNGCFDLLHPGHVRYLQEAAGHGDRLIVAINSDDSVRRLKGASRPVNSLHDRATVLAGLRSVDWLVAYEEDTPIEVLKALRPDVLVKGGDYEADEVIGHQLVTGYGGDVKVLSLIEGVSTTDTIKRILDT